MSDTPRTDSVVGQREYGSLSDSEYVRLARQLERENNQLRAELELTRKCVEIESDELLVQARESAETYSTLTANHDPSLWRVLREAYVAGYQRGYRMAEAKA